LEEVIKDKGKVIPIRAHENQQGCETSRLPHFLHSRLTNDNDTFSHMDWLAALSPKKFPGTHFCYRLSRPQGHSAAERIRSMEKYNDIGNRTHNLPACNTVPETMLLHVPFGRGWSRHYQGTILASAFKAQKKSKMFNSI
jgi:hypothetical protein